MTTPTHAQDGKSLKSQILSGLQWQILARGGDRVLRFAANIILAKLLSPSDFGLMGIVATGLGAIDALTFMATDQAIIQSSRGRDREYLETAFWTASVRGILVGLGLLAVAPLFARFFHRPDTLVMFAAIAIQPVIMGLANPRAQVLVKDMKFALWSNVRLLCSFLGVATCIVLALWLHSAWALLAGQLANQLFITLSSYAIAPFRPRFRFDKQCWLELRRFGMQAAGLTVLLSLVAEAPTIMLGRFGKTGILGVYLLSDKLANIPLEIALQVVGSVAMPAYSMIKHDRARLATLWLKALWAIALIGLPIAAILAWLGGALPRSVYGLAYAGNQGVFSTLALGGALAMVLAVTGPLFWGVGLPSYDRSVQAVRAIAVYSIGLWLVPRMGPLGMALSVTAAFVMALALAFHLVRRVIDISWLQVSEALRPGILVAAGTLVLLGLVGLEFNPGGWLRIGLGACAAAGAGVFILFLLRRGFKVQVTPQSASPAPCELAGAPGSAASK